LAFAITSTEIAAPNSYDTRRVFVAQIATVVETIG
jgi:hypothetical protein